MMAPLGTPAFGGPGGPYPAQDDTLLALHRAAAAAPPLKRRRGAACGVCAACNARDCGVCINCKDKPRFGGRGIRKQMCLQRRCTRLKKATGGDSACADWQEDPGFWLAVEGCMALLHSAVESQPLRPALLEAAATMSAAADAELQVPNGRESSPLVSLTNRPVTLVGKR